MIITCRNCNTSFNLSDELVKDTGSKVKCSKCSYIFKVLPSRIQNEPDTEQSNHHLNLEKKLTTIPYLSPDQQYVEEKEYLQKPKVDKDWDLADIEKILREEGDKPFYEDILEKNEHQEEEDDFELADLDDLFKEEFASEDYKSEVDVIASDKKPGMQISPDKNGIEDIDFSQLDDLFKEEDSNLLESEYTEELEDIDLSGIDFKTDETRSVQPSVSIEDLDVTPDDDDGILSIDKFLDDEEEISLVEGLGKKSEELNLSELDDFFQNETDDDLDFNFEIETENDKKTEPVSDKTNEAIDFDLDFNLEMEKNSTEDQKDANLSDELELDFDFFENDQEKLIDSDSADMDYVSGHNEKNSGVYTDKSANEELIFDFKDTETKDEIADFDEEFDLSDLEKIIDLEEITETDQKSLESKNEDEDRELEFDFALEPEIDEVPPLKVVLDGEELELDTSEQKEKAESEFFDKTENNELDFYMDENREEAYITEKDDYNLEETEGNFHKVFDTVTLTDTAQSDEKDDLIIKDEETEPKSRMGKLVLVVLLLVLLSAAGYAVFNMMGAQIPIIGSYIKTETPDPGNLKMIALDLNSKFGENQHAGKIFIITGTIKNEYPEPRSFVKITGKLYEPAKKISHSEQVYAGNIFSELEIRSLDLEAIKKRLNNPSGQNRSNINIKPGQSVPFMIIFSKLPQKLEEFTVEIDSSSPA